MEFKLKSTSPANIRSGCIVVSVGQGSSLNTNSKLLDASVDGLITKVMRRGDLNKSAGSTLLLNAIDNAKAQRILLIRTEKDHSLSRSKFIKLAKSLATALKQSGTKDAAIFLDDIISDGGNISWLIQQVIDALQDAHYIYDQHKSKKKPVPKLTTVAFGTTDKTLNAAAKTGIAQGTAIANGKSLAKNLGNSPGNECTPDYLARQARILAKNHIKISTRVLSEKQMQDLGMGSLLSVSAGSAVPAKLIIMQYKGGRAGAAPQVLVGKGITFDTGGISLKPGGAMDEMKFDMCGAASVFGTLQAIADLELRINVIGIVAAAENMPGSKATKPGDIVTSMSGQTIEVLNTDAEGRLVLCDALTYAERFKPAAIIDIATLTGACIIALGHHANAVFANDDELAKELLDAGNTIHDRGWQLPLWDDYQSQLDSNFADIANIGGRPAGSVTAACFLSRFTKKQRWAHLDIAGTAWSSGKAKGASGRPVPMLTQYLIDRSQD